jgi:hypothetical protein
MEKRSVYASFLFILLVLSFSLVYAESGSDRESGKSSSDSDSSDSDVSADSDSEDTEIELEDENDVEVESDDSKETKETKVDETSRERIKKAAELEFKLAKEAREKINKEVRKEFKDERERKMYEFRQKIREKNGMIEIEEKRKISLKGLDEEEKEIIAGKINARTGLNLTGEDLGNGTRLRAVLSNGKYSDVKVMPDTASANALKRLRAKCAERNCSVELREVGSGNSSRAVYQIETDKDSRVFFLFKSKMKVKAEVDAETGEVIYAKKPWWAFLAVESDEVDSETDLEDSNVAGTVPEGTVVSNESEAAAI